MKNLETTEVTKPGQVNNGNIDIIPSEEPQTSPLAIDEIFISGQRYRVPERIVMLDFWSKIKPSSRFVGLMACAICMD